jgi:hypothetical protein
MDVGDDRNSQGRRVLRPMRMLDAPARKRQAKTRLDHKTVSSARCAKRKKTAQRVKKAAARYHIIPCLYETESETRLSIQDEPLMDHLPNLITGLHLR